MSKIRMRETRYRKISKLLYDADTDISHTFLHPTQLIACTDTWTHLSHPLTAKQTKATIFWLQFFLSVSRSWYKMHCLARNPKLTVNRTSNRIVLNTTVLFSSLRNQKSVCWLSVTALCRSESSDIHFTIAKVGWPQSRRKNPLVFYAFSEP